MPVRVVLIAVTVVEVRDVVVVVVVVVRVAFWVRVNPKPIEKWH